MLLTVEACEAEHADLLRDVLPRSWRSQSLELRLQLSPHQQDPVGHGLHVVLPSGTRERDRSGNTAPGAESESAGCEASCAPFRKELRRVEGDGDDAGPLAGRVGPRGPDDLLHLGQHRLQLVGVAGDDGQVPHALI